MSTVDNFIRDNAKWLLILVFSAGILYSELEDFKNVEGRLDKKVKIINVHEEKIQELEVRISILENKQCD